MKKLFSVLPLFLAAVPALADTTITVTGEGFGLTKDAAWHDAKREAVSDCASKGGRAQTGWYAENIAHFLSNGALCTTHSTKKVNYCVAVQVLDCTLRPERLISEIRETKNILNAKFTAPDAAAPAGRTSAR